MMIIIIIIILLYHRLANCISAFDAFGSSGYWRKPFTHFHAYKQSVPKTFSPRWQLDALRPLSCPHHCGPCWFAADCSLHGDCKEQFGNWLVAEERRWGAFAKLQNCEKRILASSFLFVRPFAWNNSAPTGRIFMKFDIWGIFENLLRKLSFIEIWQEKRYFTWRLCTFLFCWILIKMRSISDRNCKENQNSHFYNQ